MTPTDAYRFLLDHSRKLIALQQAEGLLSWDQETVMPPRGTAQRAEQLAALASVTHAMQTDPRLPDWLATARTATELSPDAAADLREIARDHARAARVPADLAETLARETAAAHHLWMQARADRDFAAFAPALARIVALRREEAQAMAEPGQDPYDALLDGFEPGTRAADLAPVFARLRAGLADLLDRIQGAPRRIPGFQGAFPETAQLNLARQLAEDCGYDFAAGRIDRSAHPFTSGSGGDVRITTRMDHADPSESIFATLHETGHALYEQGIPEDLRLRPCGTHASMGVHESQSRFWENHVGRSAAFAPFLKERMAIAFGDLGLRTAEAIFAAVNAVTPGFIRTAADEAQYDLHILMRFDLERALISGDLPVEDLPAAWDDRFQADFGRRPADVSMGCLQDVHWSAGLFGYFPTYTLGNLNAAALAAAMRADLGDPEAAYGKGDVTAPLAWMRDKVHRHARVIPAGELIAQACGGAPDEGPLLAHLEEKYARIYGI